MTQKSKLHDGDQPPPEKFAGQAALSVDRVLVAVPLLVSYDIDDLRTREIAHFRNVEIQRAELAKQERKSIADSMRDNFQLTGSDLPADADPRQLHLF